MRYAYPPYVDSYDPYGNSVQKTGRRASAEIGKEAVMREVSTTKKFIGWRKLLGISLGAAALAAAATLAPVLAHHVLRAQNARHAAVMAKIARIAARETAGLARCRNEYDWSYRLARFLDEGLPGQPALSINIMPTFDDTSGLRIIGDTLYLIKLPDSDGFQRWDLLFTTNTPHAKTTVEHAPLMHGTVRRLTALFATAVRHAGDRLEQGKDGDTHHFYFPSGECGETWSPDSDTPAGRLVALVGLLKHHAQLTKKRELVMSELQIQRAVTALTKN